MEVLENHSNGLLILNEITENSFCIKGKFISCIKFIEIAYFYYRQ